MLISPLHNSLRLQVDLLKGDLVSDSSGTGRVWWLYSGGQPNFTITVLSIPALLKEEGGENITQRARGLR